MINNKITKIRLLILFAIALFFSFAGYFIGSDERVILPVFNCEFVGGGTTRGVCIALNDFNKWVTSDATGFLISMAVCVALVLLLGRLWCGYACPFGFVQDVVTTVRQKLNIAQINIPDKLKPLIVIGKWYLVFYIFFYDLCKVCPIQYFTVTATGYTSNVNTTGTMWAIIVLTAAILNDRAFCKVCPIGALMGLFNKASGSRLKKCGSACTHCRACLEVCPMNIQEVYEDRESVDITHPDCVYCMKCIEVCPEKNALRYELLGKKVLESNRFTWEVTNGTKNKR